MRTLATENNKSNKYLRHLAWASAALLPFLGDFKGMNSGLFLAGVPSDACAATACFAFLGDAWST
jgi:hypothetical protein